MIVSLIKEFTVDSIENPIFRINVNEALTIGDFTYYYFTILGVIVASLFSLAIFETSRRNNQLTTQLVKLEDKREKDKDEDSISEVRSNALELFYNLKITIGDILNVYTCVLKGEKTAITSIHIIDLSRNINILQDELEEYEFDLLYRLYSDVMKLNKAIEDGVFNEEQSVRIIKHYFNSSLLMFVHIIPFYDSVQALNIKMIILMNHLCNIYSSDSGKFYELTQTRITNNQHDEKKILLEAYIENTKVDNRSKILLYKFDYLDLVKMKSQLFFEYEKSYKGALKNSKMLLNEIENNYIDAVFSKIAKYEQTLLDCKYTGEKNVLDGWKVLLNKSFVTNSKIWGSIWTNLAETYYGNIKTDLKHGIGVSYKESIQGNKKKLVILKIGEFKDDELSIGLEISSIGVQTKIHHYSEGKIISTHVIRNDTDSISNYYISIEENIGKGTIELLKQNVMYEGEVSINGYYNGNGRIRSMLDNTILISGNFSKGTLKVGNVFGYNLSYGLFTNECNDIILKEVGYLAREFYDVRTDKFKNASQTDLNNVVMDKFDFQSLQYKGKVANGLFDDSEGTLIMYGKVIYNEGFKNGNILNKHALFNGIINYDED